MNWLALALLPVIVVLVFAVGRSYGQAEGRLQERRKRPEVNAVVEAARQLDSVQMTKRPLKGLSQAVALKLALDDLDKGKR